MQWNSEMNAGFSTAQKTWLPISQDYRTRNVKVGILLYLRSMIYASEA